MDVKTLRNSIGGLILVSLLLLGCVGDNYGNGNPVPSGPNVDCDPNVVYFDKEILPILASGCAYSGCHDAATAADDVMLDTYDHVMATGDVTPGDPNDSELYTVLRDDPEDIMPPPPDAPLSNPQIELIKKWINQGAKYLVCNSGCDNANPTWSARVWPVVDGYCRGCHSGGRPDGGISLTNYAEVKASVNGGKFLGSINGTPGISPMPPSSSLSQCDIDAIAIWIENGMMEN